MTPLPELEPPVAATATLVADVRAVRLSDLAERNDVPTWPASPDDALSPPVAAFDASV